MTIINVTLAETIDQWRQDTNTLATQVGDIANLNTSSDSSVVTAINSLVVDVSNIQSNLDSDIAALGTIAKQNANNVNITGGSITNITNLAVADGGTGADSAGQARLNLGVQATITGAVTTVTSSDLTASRTLVSNASGKIAASSITSTELGYLSGVTSAVQTQLDGKQATITGAATTITSSNLTASRAVVSNASGKVAVSSVTDTELGYVSGVTSSIQTQLNAKQDSDATLTALAAYNTNGLLTQTAADTFAGRTVTGTTDQILVTNGDGVSGNPIIAAVIASQAEAEAGTDSTKLMTPQRVAQAIAALSGGLTLLGTLTTTSLSTQSLTGLTLTGYNFLLLEFNAVSHSSGSTQHILFGAGQITSNAFTSSDEARGTALVSLNSGILTGSVTRGALPTSPNEVISQTGYSTATTSVSLSTASGGTFDGGSVRVYGMN